MRSITFQKAGGPVIVLSNGTKPWAVTHYDPQPECLQQVIARPRAKHPDVYDRGNTMMVIRFTVRRAYSTLTSPHTFQHVHAQQVNGKGTFVTIERSGGSAVVTGRDFLLKVLGFTPDGVGLYIHYEARGGSLA